MAERDDIDGARRRFLRSVAGLGVLGAPSAERGSTGQPPVPGESGIAPPYSVGAPMPTLGSAITILGTDTRQEALERLATAGVSFVRYDFRWDRMEPEPDEYDFTAEDDLVAQAHDAGLETLGLLAYGNPNYSDAGGGARPGWGRRWAPAVRRRVAAVLPAGPRAPPRVPPVRDGGRRPLRGPRR